MITVAGGGVVAWALDEMRSRRDRPKTDSEIASNLADAAESNAAASKSSADAYASVIGRLSALEAQVSAQSRTIIDQDRRITRLRGWAADVMTGINVLIGQLREVRQEPRWQPPALDEDSA